MQNVKCTIVKTFDKFYRKVVDGQYRELHESIDKRCNSTRIEWRLNNKYFSFTTSNFRDLI